MFIAVNNTAKRQELDFKQRVLSKMKLQIKKKLVAGERNSIREKLPRSVQQK